MESMRIREGTDRCHSIKSLQVRRMSLVPTEALIHGKRTFSTPAFSSTALFKVLSSGSQEL